MTFRSFLTSGTLGLVLVAGPLFHGHSGHAEAEPYTCAGADMAAIGSLNAPTEGPITIGTSFEQRPVKATRVGNGGPVVVWVGGIHGDEVQGKVLTERLLATPPEPAVTGGMSLVLITDLNPDGRNNRTRSNANRVDLNRNFPAANFQPADDHGAAPLSEPESCVLANVLTELEPALVVIAHAHSELRAINFDGPARDLAEVFAKNAVDENFTVLGDGPGLDTYPTPTPGSLGSWWGVDGRHKLLTIEWSKAEDVTNAADSAEPAIRAVFSAVAASSLATGTNQPAPSSSTQATLPGASDSPPTSSGEPVQSTDSPSTSVTLEPSRNPTAGSGGNPPKPQAASKRFGDSVTKPALIGGGTFVVGLVLGAIATFVGFELRSKPRS